MTSVQRAGHSNWVLGGIASLAICGLIGAVLIAVKESDDTAKLTRAQGNSLRCISGWVGEFNQRDRVVEGYAVKRSSALGRLQLFQAHHPHATGPVLVNLRLAYIAADNAYLDAEKSNPRPPFTCASGLPPLRSPNLPEPSTPSIVTGGAPRPRSSPSLTTVTRSLPVPGPTVTVRARTTIYRTVTAPPGKAAAVTVTRTVTASPSCILGPVCIAPLHSP